MQGIVAKHEIGKCNRTYAARVGSRDGAIIHSLTLKQATEASGWDQQRGAWSSATILMFPIIDGLEGRSVQVMALENKIAYQFGFGDGIRNATFAARIGSRNGGTISSVTIKQTVDQDQIV